MIEHCCRARALSPPPPSSLSPSLSLSPLSPALARALPLSRSLSFARARARASVDGHIGCLSSVMYVHKVGHDVWGVFPFMLLFFLLAFTVLVV